MSQNPGAELRECSHIYQAYCLDLIPPHPCSNEMEKSKMVVTSMICMKLAVWMIGTYSIYLSQNIWFVGMAK